MKVYSLSGIQVRLLFRGRLDPGEHEIFWDGRREDGSSLPSGIYLCRLEREGSPGSGGAIKMTLLK